MGLGIQLSESVYMRIKNFAVMSGVIVLAAIERGSAQLIRQAVNSVVGVNDITLNIENLNNLFSVIDRLQQSNRKFVVFIDYQSGSRESMEFIRRLNEQKVRFAVSAPESSQKVFVNIWENGGKHIIVRGCHTHESIASKIADLIISDNEEERDLDGIEELIQNSMLDEALSLCNSKLKKYLENREQIKRYPISRVMYCMGLVYEQKCDLNQAETYYTKAIAANKLFVGESEITNLPNIQALNKMANLKLQQGNYNEAIGYLLKLDKFNPEKSTRRMELAKIFCQKAVEDPKFTKVAIEYFESAIRLTRKYSPDLVSQRLMEASAYLDPIDTDRSITFMSEVYTNIEDINDVVYLNNIAARLIKDGSVKKAFEYLARAVEINPEDPTLTFNMAKAYFAMKKFVDSEKWAFKGMKLNPNFLEEDPSLSKMLAKLYYLLRDKSSSLKYANIAIVRYPEDHEIVELLNNLTNNL